MSSWFSGRSAVCRSAVLILVLSGLFAGGCDRAAPGDGNNANGNNCEQFYFVDFPCGIGAACVLDASQLMSANVTYGCEAIYPAECCSGAGCNSAQEYCSGDTVCAYPEADPLLFQLDSGYQGGGDRPSCVSLAEVCGGPQGLTCAAGQYCEFVGALCPNGAYSPDDCIGPRGYGVTSFCDYRDAGGYGWCRRVADPDDCDAAGFDPVCGCDGMTYNNDCFRQAAGVSLLGPWACPD